MHNSGEVLFDIMYLVSLHRKNLCIQWLSRIAMQVKPTEQTQPVQELSDVIAARMHDQGRFPA